MTYALYAEGERAATERIVARIQHELVCHPRPDGMACTCLHCGIARNLITAIERGMHNETETGQ